MFKALLSLTQASACETAEDRAGTPRPKFNAALRAPLVWLPAPISAAFLGAKSLLEKIWLEHFSTVFARLRLYAARVNSTQQPFFPCLLFFGCEIGAHWGSVMCLLFARSPLAVARRIMSVVISALQRESFRSRSHIIVKVIERLEPSLANGNAARSVPSIHWVTGVGASVAHLPPNAIKRMTREPAALFVFHEALYHVS